MFMSKDGTGIVRAAIQSYILYLYESGRLDKSGGLTVKTIRDVILVLRLAMDPSSSNGLEKRPKLRFPGFDEPWCSHKFSSVLHGTVCSPASIFLPEIFNSSIVFPTVSSSAVSATIISPS